MTTALAGGREEPALRVERVGATARLVMCRPERLNLYDDALAAALRVTLTDIAGDGAVDTIVLTADGDTFSAGADLRQEGGTNTESGDRSSAARAILSETLGLFQMLETTPQTTVAGVNGDAYGAGLILALLCDVMVVANEARLGFTMGRFGLADGITTTRLATRVGLTVASDLLLTGRIINGEEAHALRLATRCAPRSDFAACLEATVTAVRRVAPVARQRIKAALQRPLPPYDFETHLASYLSDEVGEGAAAFMERRPPAWESR